MIRHQLTIKRAHLKPFVAFTNHLNVAVLLPDGSRSTRKQRWCDVVCFIEKPKEEQEKAVMGKIYDYLNACKQFDLDQERIRSYQG